MNAYGVENLESPPMGEGWPRLGDRKGTGAMSCDSANCNPAPLSVFALGESTLNAERHRPNAKLGCYLEYAMVDPPIAFPPRLESDTPRSKVAISLSHSR